MPRAICSGRPDPARRRGRADLPPAGASSCTRTPRRPAAAAATRPSPRCSRRLAAAVAATATTRLMRGTVPARRRWPTQGDLADLYDGRRRRALLKLPRRPARQRPDASARRAALRTLAQRRRPAVPAVRAAAGRDVRATATRRPAPTAGSTCSRHAAGLRQPRRGARGVPGRRRPARRGLDVAAAAGRARLRAPRRGGARRGAARARADPPGRARPGPRRLVLLGASRRRAGPGAGDRLRATGTGRGAASGGRRARAPTSPWPPGA